MVSKLKPTGLKTASSQEKESLHTAEVSGFMPVARWAKMHIINN